MAEYIPGWLASQDWDLARSWLPIVCADVLVLEAAATEGPVERVGLIWRDTPHQGRKWCLVGGRVLLNETLEDAILRQVKSTLGNAAIPVIPHNPWPAHIAQYFPKVREGYLLDPRQHSVALTFAIPVLGAVSPTGEAHAFEWFAPTALPAPTEFGFGHDKVAGACIAALEAKGRIHS